MPFFVTSNLPEGNLIYFVFNWALKIELLKMCAQISVTVSSEMKSLRCRYKQRKAGIVIGLIVLLINNDLSGS